MFTWAFIICCLLKLGLLDRRTSLEVFIPYLFECDCTRLEAGKPSWAGRVGELLDKGFKTTLATLQLDKSGTWFQDELIFSFWNSLSSLYIYHGGHCVGQEIHTLLYWPCRRFYGRNLYRGSISRDTGMWRVRNNWLLCTWPCYWCCWLGSYLSRAVFACRRCMFAATLVALSGQLPEGIYLICLSAAQPGRHVGLLAHNIIKITSWICYLILKLNYYLKSCS